LKSRHQNELNKNISYTHIVPSSSASTPFPRFSHGTAVRGMVFMVVLLSFGLLVGNVGFPGGTLRSPISDVNTRILNTEQVYQPVSNPLLLSEILNSNGGAQSDFAERLLKKQMLEECQTNESDFSLRGSSRFKEKDFQPLPSNEMNIVSTSRASASFSSKEINPRSNPIDSFDWKPNTTYLVCCSMKHIVPPSHVTNQFNPEIPQNLTFFIVSKSNNQKEEDSIAEKVLEVTCLMSSMSVLSSESLISLKDVF